MWLQVGIATLAYVPLIQAQAVFAHFMVENVKSWKPSQWASEIGLAQATHIDAFALNMRADDDSVDTSLKNAFNAAECQDFKLFFSFDYAGGGPWAKSRVESLIKQYQPSQAYYQFRNRPLVSTFEGASNSSDWAGIKAATNAFFVPDWSSIGPEAALDLNVVDGLFSWNAWPNGPNDMTISDDTYYIRSLNQSGTVMPYMMPVSPWFYTNLPGYDKNWLWRGDDLWYDRWQQVLTINPAFVQIISWNDYGESHYIGPLHKEEYNAFKIGKAPFNYVQNMPHDGWRVMLPYLIDTYKNGAAQITQEALVAWYRISPGTACPDGGTTGNVASHGQQVYAPSEIVQDKVFYSALLNSSASIAISVGGTVLPISWENVPISGTGIYHGSVAYNGSTGDVMVTVSRNDSSPIVLRGVSINTTCSNRVQNWNAWVGSQLGSCSVCPETAQNLSKSVCLQGAGNRLGYGTLSQVQDWIMLLWIALGLSFY